MAVWLFAQVISVNQLDMQCGCGLVGWCARVDWCARVGWCAGVWVGGLVCRWVGVPVGGPGWADKLVVLGTGNAAG